MHLSALSPTPPDEDITIIRLPEIVCDIHPDRERGVDLMKNLKHFNP